MKGLEQVLTIDPEDTDLLFAFSAVCYKLDQFDRGQETLDLELSIVDANVDLLELQSESHFLRRLLQAKRKMADGP